jgi:hypothetical protein
MTEQRGFFYPAHDLLYLLEFCQAEKLPGAGKRKNYRKLNKCIEAGKGDKKDLEAPS